MLVDIWFAFNIILPDIIIHRSLSTGGLPLIYCNPHHPLRLRLLALLSLPSSWQAADSIAEVDNGQKKSTNEHREKRWTLWIARERKRSSYPSRTVHSSSTTVIVVVLCDKIPASVTPRQHNGLCNTSQRQQLNRRNGRGGGGWNTLLLPPHSNDPTCNNNQNKPHE